MCLTSSATTCCRSSTRMIRSFCGYATSLSLRRRVFWLRSAPAGSVDREHGERCVHWCGHPECDVSAALQRRDPPVRADGLCFVCLKPRDPERSSRYAGGTAETDPFCSSTCARDYHDNPVPDESIWSLQPKPHSAGPVAAQTTRRYPMRIGPSEQVTLDCLTAGPMTGPQIAASRGCNPDVVSQHLFNLLKKGLVRRVSRGVYERTTAASVAQAERESQDAETVLPSPEPDSEGATSPAPVVGRSPDAVGTDNGSRSADPDDDEFPDKVKDAYAFALIAGLRAFADTLEQELALT